jgi:alpha-L-fucosidase
MSDVSSALRAIDAVIDAGPFDATWESLEDYVIPRWYKDAKFGIFSHWGVYSVPGFGNEWYARRMYLAEDDVFSHHVAAYGPQNEHGYKDLIPHLTAEKYDPAAWADLFVEAGARFVMPVAEHHDGFPMYDSDYTEWSAAKMGPCRDTIGELAAAVRDRGMVFAASSHRAENWWFYDGGRKFDSDVQDDRWRALYGPAQPKESVPTAEFMDDWLARSCEIVDKYRPLILWFDWWIEEAFWAPYIRRFAAYYYNRGAEWGGGVAINFKHRAFADGTAVFDVERGQLAAAHPVFWQTDTSVSKNSWGYIDNHDYKTADAIIGDLIDIVSKNGTLLLNIGPRPDGTIPEHEQEMLRDIGAWLKVNGEAIYETRPWKVFGEGPTEVVGGSFNDVKREGFTAEDIRFTRKGDTLYAVAMGNPPDGKLTIRTLAEKSVNCLHIVSSVELLGSPDAVAWTRDADGLHIELSGPPPTPTALAFRIR